MSRWGRRCKRMTSGDGLYSRLLLLLLSTSNITFNFSFFFLFFILSIIFLFSALFLFFPSFNIFSMQAYFVLCSFTICFLLFFSLSKSLTWTKMSWVVRCELFECPGCANNVYICNGPGCIYIFPCQFKKITALNFQKAKYSNIPVKSKNLKTNLHSFAYLE